MPGLCLWVRAWVLPCCGCEWLWAGSWLAHLRLNRPATTHVSPGSVSCCAHPSPPPFPSALLLQEASTEDCPVKMKLVAPPLYVLTTQTLDKAKGVEVSFGPLGLKERAG